MKYAKILAVCMVSCLSILALGTSLVLNQKERRANRMLSVAEKFSPGTSIENLRRTIESAGLVLDGPHSCEGNNCSYSMTVDNAPLPSLRLAPPIFLRIVFRSQGAESGTMTVSFITSGPADTYGGVIRALDERDGRLALQGESMKVSHVVHNDQQKKEVFIDLSNNMLAERRSTFSLNTKCLGQLRGCKDSAEMFPRAW